MFIVSLGVVSYVEMWTAASEFIQWNGYYSTGPDKQRKTPADLINKLITPVFYQTIYKVIDIAAATTAPAPASAIQQQINGAFWRNVKLCAIIRMVFD